MAASNHHHHNDYRGYHLRNTVDVESGVGQQHHRLHHHHHHPGGGAQGASEPSSAYRPLLFGTLAVMGLLQVASSVAILLHLTGYLQEVDLSSAPHRPIEEVQTEPVMDALKDTRKNRRCKTSKEVLPSAHLPIKSQQEYAKKGEPKDITIDWDEVHGLRNRMDYQKGKLVVLESGFYYVYAKTCFRYYVLEPEDGVGGVGGGQGAGAGQAAGRTPAPDVSNTQLIQYVYHERVKQNVVKAAVLMKTGSTMRWGKKDYNMYCSQQGRGVRLEEGDALYVNVSNAWLLDPEGKGTYFGAMKLGN